LNSTTCLKDRDFCRVAKQFADFTSRIYIGGTGAFNFNIGAEDVKLFLLKQTYKSFLFLS